MNSQPQRSQREERPWRDLIDTVWKAPLYALPFALFFGLLNGGTWNIYVACYKAALLFAFFIRLAIWTVGHQVIPRLSKGSGAPGTYPIARDVAFYIGAGLLAAAAVTIIALINAKKDDLPVEGAVGAH